MNIKEKIIRRLGGVTMRQATDIAAVSYAAGKKASLMELEGYMRDINGEDAEVWCDLVWKWHLERKERIERLMSGMEKERGIKSRDNE